VIKEGRAWSLEIRTYRHDVTLCLQVLDALDHDSPHGRTVDIHKVPRPRESPGPASAPSRPDHDAAQHIRIRTLLSAAFQSVQLENRYRLGVKSGTCRTSALSAYGPGWAMRNTSARTSVQVLACPRVIRIQGCKRWESRGRSRCWSWIGLTRKCRRGLECLWSRLMGKIILDAFKRAKDDWVRLQIVM
jgi:hypothetical protein